MKTKEKSEINFTEIEKINPVDRQKILKELFSKAKDRELLKRISEEIIRAEIEEENLEKNLEEPQKEEKIETTSLDNLVERFSEDTPEREKENQKETGKVYGADTTSLYDAYKVDLYSHDHKSFNIEITGNTGDKVTTGLGEQDLSSNFSLKRLSEMYNKGKKEKDHGH